MKMAPFILTTILAVIPLAPAADASAQKRVIEFTICRPIEESFAIETIFADGENEPIRIRQYHVIPDRLDPENPALEMFTLEMTETWELDVRVIAYEGESTVNRLPLKVSERRKEVERVRKLWARGNFTEKRAGERYVARTQQGTVAD